MATKRDLIKRAEAKERVQIISNPKYAVALTLTDDPTAETFESVTTVTFDAKDGAATFINLDADQVRSIELNGVQVPLSAWNENRIQLDHCAAKNTLKVVANCRYEHTGVGLHRAVDPADGNVYLYTHFEPFDAHRVFACFDQPDIKGTFQFTITAPDKWTVISNTHEGAHSTSNGHTTHAFGETKPISTYLSAFAGGEYAKVTTDHHGIELSLLCRKSMLQYLEADEIFEITKQGIDFYEDLFGVKYPFEKYGQIFVPQSNMGAMENPGCITFNENYLFRSRVTQSTRASRANVILHEMAHNWFGDLVTMEWWDDLWLNESFATYLSFYAQVSATRFKQSWTEFSFTRKIAALTQDQMSTTHPIVANIPDTYAARQNFDAITYSKGASVLKQLAAWVTAPFLKKGLQKYCKTYAWKNTTLDQFLGALEAASGQPLDQWADLWLKSKGMNMLESDIAFEQGFINKASLLQRVAYGDDVLRPHRIGFGLYAKDAAGKLQQTEYIECVITGAKTDLQQLVGKRADCVLVNDNDLTYAKVRLDPTSQAFLESHLSELESPLSRQVFRSILWDMMRDADLSASAYVKVVTQHIPSETDPDVLTRMYNDAKNAIQYASASHVTQLKRTILATAKSGFMSAPQGSDAQLAHFRTIIAVTQKTSDLRWLKNIYEGKETIPGITIDISLRWSILSALVVYKRAFAQDIDTELLRDHTDFGQRNVLTLNARRPTAEAKAAAWKQMNDDPKIALADIRALILGFHDDDGDPFSAPYIANYEQALQGWWATRTPEVATALTAGLFPKCRNNPAVIPMVERLLARDDLTPVARRLLIEGKERTERIVRGQQFDGKRQQLQRTPATQPNYTMINEAL